MGGGGRKKNQGKLQVSGIGCWKVLSSKTDNIGCMLGSVFHWLNFSARGACRGSCTPEDMWSGGLLTPWEMLLFYLLRVPYLVHVLS